MKTFWISFTIGMLLAIAAIKIVRAQSQVFPQTCNPGLIVRPNGVIVIDAWKSFDHPIPGDQGAVKYPTFLGYPQPPAIDLGHTLPDNTKICIENSEADSTRCIPLSSVRKLAYPSVK